MIHFLFNIIGTIIIAVILLLGERWIEAGILTISNHDIGRSVANAHTFFKVFQVLVLFPFAQWIVKLTYLLVPDRKNEKQEEGFHLEYIRTLQCIFTQHGCGRGDKGAGTYGKYGGREFKLRYGRPAFSRRKKLQSVYETEKNINYMNHAIT